MHEFAKAEESVSASRNCATLMATIVFRYENQLMMMDNQSFNMDQMQFAHENIENTITMVRLALLQCKCTCDSHAMLKVAATKAASAVMKVDDFHELTILSSNTYWCSGKVQVT